MLNPSNLDEAITCVAFSTNDKFMAAATEKENIYLWRIQPESKPNFAETQLDISWRGGCLAFSPDGKKLASGCHNGVIYLWDIEQPKAAPIFFKGHQHGIRAISFSHDGKYLASASDDQTIRIWVVETSTLAEIARQRVSRDDLDEKEVKELLEEFVGNSFSWSDVLLFLNQGVF